jgi:hypothetical protein
MRLGKFFLIMAIIGSGFGAGYLWRNRQFAAQGPQSVAGQYDAVKEPMPPGYDPSLVLPPASEKGVTIDPPIELVRGHFLRQTGFEQATNDEPPLVDGPPLLPPEPNPLRFDQSPPWPVIAEGPPALEPAPLPPVIRLPAPSDEEPELLPLPHVKRVVFQEFAPCMYVNARDLRLDYDVIRKGPSGIKAVELWGRRSSGSDYECVDRMESDSPPFATRLGSEGNYEFRLVMISGTGVKSPVPTRDDAPDLCVCLDTTPPVVEMLPPLADMELTGVIRLRWKAEDKHLDDNPIHLEFSLDGRTWLPIADNDEWLPNTGVYSWKLPDNLPSELHLRVSARDKAGNVGESRSPRKVPVDLTVPEGRIGGIVETLPMPRKSGEEIPTPAPPQIETIIPLTMPREEDGPSKDNAHERDSLKRELPLNEKETSDGGAPDAQWELKGLLWIDWLHKQATKSVRSEPMFWTDHTGSKFVGLDELMRLPEKTEALLVAMCPSYIKLDRDGCNFMHDPTRLPAKSPIPFPMPYSDDVKAGAMLSERHESFLERVESSVEAAPASLFSFPIYFFN